MLAGRVSRLDEKTMDERADAPEGNEGDEGMKA
jgi:hypothetical protein